MATIGFAMMVATKPWWQDKGNNVVVDNKGNGSRDVLEAMI